MKIILNFMKIVPLALVFFSLTSCNDDDDGIVITPVQQTIVDRAIATPDLTSLVAALQAADGNLVGVLSGNGPFTVLAPTNAAFAAFLDANNFNSLDEVPTDVLSQILLNHVIAGSVSSSDLIGLGNGYTSTQADGAGNQKLSLYFNTNNGVRFNNVSSVSSADITASNGIIHIVDAVIGLPNIVDHAVANANFSSLVGALTADGNTTFTNLLSTPGDFTVFAPTNDAFTNFTNPNGNALASILSNHVIAGTTAISTGLSNSYVNTAATFNNTTDHFLSMYINTDNGVRINGISSVVIADVVATNGVIHAVDTVIDLPTVVDFALADPTFETLVAALTRDDLTFDYVTTLSTPNGTSPAPFTVFAPTNTAFGELLTELNVDNLSDIAEPTLKATLDHHAVASLNVKSSQLTDNFTVPTLGGNITANITGGATLTDTNNRTSNIIAVDVQASNGIIHVIDKVVLPPLQ
jgi:uncharacterized surface protein with fasciclin (FAS1) repeats